MISDDLHQLATMIRGRSTYFWGCHLSPDDCVCLIAELRRLADHVRRLERQPSPPRYRPFEVIRGNDGGDAA